MSLLMETSLPVIQHWKTFKAIATFCNGQYSEN